jgi:hypothetical protein
MLICLYKCMNALCVSEKEKRERECVCAAERRFPYLVEEEEGLAGKDRVDDGEQAEEARLKIVHLRQAGPPGGMQHTQSSEHGPGMRAMQGTTAIQASPRVLC